MSQFGPEIVAEYCSVSACVLALMSLGNALTSTKMITSAVISVPLPRMLRDVDLEEILLLAERPSR